MSIIVDVKELSKSFISHKEERLVLKSLSLRVERGSFVVLIGPSGCGKSTLLNIVAGLLPATSGSISYRGTPVQGTHLGIGYLTQRDTLMPWRTVKQNIEMPLEIRGVTKDLRRRKADELIHKVGLAGFEQAYPRELSGGMLRRVSIARLLVTDPETLLMDEPFAALDAQLRQDLQSELLTLCEASGKSVLFVTHDLEEAIVLGDRVVVLGVYGHVALDTSIYLSRPRDVTAIRFQSEFFTIYRRLWNALRETQGRQEDEQ